MSASDFFVFTMGNGQARPEASNSLSKFMLVSMASTAPAACGLAPFTRAGVYSRNGGCWIAHVGSTVMAGLTHDPWRRLDPDTAALSRQACRGVAWLRAGAPATMRPTRRRTMQTRREMLTHSATVAGLLAAAGLLPKPPRRPGRRRPSRPRPWPTRQGARRRRPHREQGRHHHRPRHRRERRRRPGRRGHHAAGVKRLLLLVEKNPSALAAVFDVTDAVEANIATRVKMGQSSNVFAVAMMADGKVLYARRKSRSRSGGCGGEPGASNRSTNRRRTSHGRPDAHSRPSRR